MLFLVKKKIDLKLHIWNNTRTSPIQQARAENAGRIQDTCIPFSTRHPLLTAPKSFTFPKTPIPHIKNWAPVTYSRAEKHYGGEKWKNASQAAAQRGLVQARVWISSSSLVKWEKQGLLTALVGGIKWDDAREITENLMTRCQGAQLRGWWLWVKTQGSTKPWPARQLPAFVNKI